MSKVRFEFEAIGTHWEIEVFGEVEDEAGLLKRIRGRIDEFDLHYSRFRDDSLVMEMARKTGKYRLPDDGQYLLDVYWKLYRLTEGKFSPLVGQVLVDAGYDAGYSLRKKDELVRSWSWDEALGYEWPVLEIKRPVILDFGAGGKGYLVDLVAKVIEEEGFEEYVIDAGGDILCNGRSLRVGLEHPVDTGKVVGVLRVEDQSICGSAGNRRKWEDFHHIIDPDVLQSPKEILATWVVAESTIVADVLATCLMLVEPKRLIKEFDFEFVRLGRDLRVEVSDGFVGEFFWA